jgi:hypothetical protein
VICDRSGRVIGEIGDSGPVAFDALCDLGRLAGLGIQLCFALPKYLSSVRECDVIGPVHDVLLGECGVVDLGLHVVSRRGRLSLLVHRSDVAERVVCVVVPSGYGAACQPLGEALAVAHEHGEERAGQGWETREARDLALCQFRPSCAIAEQVCVVRLRKAMSAAS